MLSSKGKVGSPGEGYDKVKQSLSDGTALQKFQEMLVAQNVAPELAKRLCDPKANLWEELPIEKLKMELTAETDGLVSSIDAMAVAKVLTELGTGRLKPTDTVNHGIGMVLKTRKGAYLNKGQVWAVLYHQQPLRDNYLNALKNALKIEPGDIGDEKPVESRIIDIIRPTFVA